MTRFDTLTGVPNRAFLHDQTEAALAALKRRGPFAILFVELDDLTQVNDTLGHTCGDALLCAVADRLRSVVRGSDVVARFGGEEFVVLQIRWVTSMKVRPWPSKSWMRSAGRSKSMDPDCGGRQHRHSRGAARWRQRRPAVEEHRYGALPRQVERPRLLAVFGAGHGREGARAAQLQLDLRNALAADAFQVH